MTITATSHTIKYKCSITGRRGCPPRYKGESITKTCEECHCYKFPGIKRERCFDKNGNSTESALFPFLSGEECVASCKSEGCVSVGKFASRFACLCTDGDPCFGGESFKKKCNCVACHCDLDEELVKRYAEILLEQLYLEVALHVGNHYSSVLKHVMIRDVLV